MNATETRKVKALLNQARKIQAAIYDLECSITEGYENQKLFDARTTCGHLVDDLVAATSKRMVIAEA